MKKNTVKLFVLALALGSTLIVSAQEKKLDLKQFETDVETRKAHAEKYNQQFTADYEKAVEMAKINNWPLKIKKDNGTIMKLIKVDNEGKPVYRSTYNEESAITSRVDKLRTGGGLGLNLTGKFSNDEPMQIGMWDGEYPQLTHPEYASRFETLGDGTGADIEDHPTHVMGTLIAAGTIQANSRGMAYEAFGRAANFLNDTSEMANAAEAGLIISNHSYGIPTAPKGVYMEDYAMEVDELTFDNPYYQPVFSAGNSNTTAGTYNLISDSAIAKNVITVGATYKLDWINQTTPVISDFSSWGPAKDNRIKPDISTDGVNVYSTLPDSGYGEMSGTSMSAPGVTGSLALIQQYYAELHTAPEDLDFEKTFMLSSTLRALTAHCATEAGTVGPDAIFGWGILDVGKMADVIKKEGQETILYQNVLTVNQVYELEVEALPGQNLVATLAWTDPAPVMADHSTINSGIVNNLDLSIVKGATTSRPWKLTSPTGAASTGINNVDTTEKIEIANASGTYKIRVSHQGTTLKNPANPSQPQQVYSLVVSGINATLDNKDFSKDSFSVWPNPAKGYLNIAMVSGTEDNAVATVYDMQGRLVLSSKLSGENTQLNIGNLTTGVYMISVANGNKNEVKKFIVE